MATTLEHTEISLARKNLPICVLDDDPDQVEITTTRLDKAGFPVVGTTNPQDALHKIRVGGCRAVLADFKMPAMDGLIFLQKTLQYDPGIYVILMSGFYDVQTAIEAIKGGAYDFLRKPLDYARLEKTLDDLAAVFTQRSEIRDLEEQLFRNSQFQGIVGKSPAMLEVFDLARKVARHFTNVLITGPTGSGKELVARALHELSPSRANDLPCAIVRRSWTRSWKASCLGMFAVRLPEPPTRAPACLSMPMAEPCFSTRLARPRRRCRPSCCAWSKIGKFSASVHRN